MYCDGSKRLGALSYLVPEQLRVHVGDAVEVPFGTRILNGVVVGPGDPSKATRAITAVHGRRTAPADIALAHSIATHHFVDASTVYPRLSPTRGRGAEPLEPGPLALSDAIPDPPPMQRACHAGRRLLLRAPLTDPAVLACYEIARLAAEVPGQILVLCPTSPMVTRVMALLAGGAARLDSRAPRGAWAGFCAGTVRVGVGTRAAALYSAAALGAIVVVEEDHPGHRESRQPHTHARDIANSRTRALRIPLSLISANPTPQALGAGVDVVPVGRRADWPRTRLINRASLDPLERWAPPQLKAVLARASASGKDPVVVVQRRAAVRRCTHCGQQRDCTACDSSLCTHRESSPCPQCRMAVEVRMVGWDAERVQRLFSTPIRPVTLAELAGIENAGLVVIFDIDAALSAAELIPDSFATGLILEAVRAAGRGGEGVIALTDTPALPVLQDLFERHDQIAVTQRALEAARAVHLPPFGRLVTVSCGQSRPPDVSNWPGVVHGPHRTGDQWEALVRLEHRQLLELEPHLARLRRRGKVRVTVT